MLGAVPAFTDARVQQSCGLMLEASVQVYLSGMFAGAVQAGITTPSDLLKIRMQLQPHASGSPAFIGPRRMLRNVVKAEGIRGEPCFSQGDVYDMRPRRMTFLLFALERIRSHSSRFHAAGQAVTVSAQARPGARTRKGQAMRQLQ